MISIFCLVPSLGLTHARTHAKVRARAHEVTPWRRFARGSVTLTHVHTVLDILLSYTGNLYSIFEF